MAKTGLKHVKVFATMSACHILGFDVKYAYNLDDHQILNSFYLSFIAFLGMVHISYVQSRSLQRMSCLKT